MGNIVATVAWDPVPNDNAIKSLLRNLAIDSGLSVGTDPSYAHYVKNKSIFIADISGLWLALDREHQRNKVEEFGKRSKTVLQNMGINNSMVYIDDLAL